jgi:hypothetical protein
VAPPGSIAMPWATSGSGTGDPTASPGVVTGTSAAPPHT